MLKLFRLLRVVPLPLRSVQSVVSDSLRPHRLQHTRTPCPSPTPGVYSKLMSIESVMSSNHLILCRPLLLLPSILSSIRVIFSEAVLHIRWPKYWSFSISISPSNEYSGLISFRIDCFHLLAVHDTLKSLLQHQSSKASILLHSVQFSCSVVVDSWRLHESQHTRPPCPSPTPGVHSDSSPSSR